MRLRSLAVTTVMLLTDGPAFAGTCDQPLLSTLRACQDVLAQPLAQPIVGWRAEFGHIQVIVRAGTQFHRHGCRVAVPAEAERTAAAASPMLEAESTAMPLAHREPVEQVYPPPTVGVPPARPFDASALTPAAWTKLYAQARALDTDISELGLCAGAMEASCMAAQALINQPAGAYTVVQFQNSETGRSQVFDGRGRAIPQLNIARIDGTDIDTDPGNSWSTVAAGQVHDWIAESDLALQRVATEMPADAEVLHLWANEHRVEVRYRRADQLRDWKLTVSGRVIDAEADAALPECQPGLSPHAVRASYERERSSRGRPPVSASGNLIWECTRGGPPRWW